MTYPIQALLQMGVIPPVNFPTDSRYYGSGTLTYTPPGGDPITYLPRRFVPAPGSPNFTSMAQHVVVQGDRLDLIAARYYGDPLLFWQVCDANGAMRPNELVETVDATIQIPMPQSIPGVPNT